MQDDIIIEEVRNAGKKLSEQYQNDIHLFGMMLQKRTQESRSAGWKVITKEELDKLKER